VRGSAAWALGRIGGDEARAALEEALGREQDPEVRREIELALQRLGHRASSPEHRPGNASSG